MAVIIEEPGEEILKEMESYIEDLVALINGFLKNSKGKGREQFQIISACLLEVIIQFSASYFVEMGRTRERADEFMAAYCETLRTSFNHTLNKAYNKTH